MVDVAALRAQVVGVRQLIKTGDNVGAHGNTLRLTLADISDKVAALAGERGGLGTPAGLQALGALDHVRWAQVAVLDPARSLDDIAHSVRKNMLDALSHIKP